MLQKLSVCKKYEKISINSKNIIKNMNLLIQQYEVFKRVWQVILNKCMNVGFDIFKLFTRILSIELFLDCFLLIALFKVFQSDLGSCLFFQNNTFFTSSYELIVQITKLFIFKVSTDGFSFLKLKAILT